MSKPTLERHERTFETGAEVFKEGDVGTEMYVVRSGLIEISRRVHGRKKLVALFEAGDFFGEMAILTRDRRSATALVLEDARLLVIDAATFEEMLTARAEISLRMIKQMAARLAEANAQIDVLTLRNTTARTAKMLSYLADRHGRRVEDGTGIVDIGDQDLANLIALDVDALRIELDRLARQNLVKRGPHGLEIAPSSLVDEFIVLFEKKTRD